MREETTVKIIALVGESGTGKTTIARHLAERGAGHIDADGLAHEILASDEGVCGRIRDRFGGRVFTKGMVDRKKLGAVVFGDARALRDLNAIIHPPILDACMEELRRFEQEGRELAVIDAALLLDATVPLEVDFTIALKCGRDEQTRRLLAAGDLSPEEIRARLDSQAHIQNSFYKADAVVDTNREKSVVFAEIDGLIEPLLEHR